MAVSPWVAWDAEHRNGNAGARFPKGVFHAPAFSMYIGPLCGAEMINFSRRLTASVRQ